MPSNLVLDTSKRMISSIIEDYINELYSAVEDAEGLMTTSKNELEQAIADAHDAVAEFGKSFELGEPFIRFVSQRQFVGFVTVMLVAFMTFL